MTIRYAFAALLLVSSSAQATDLLDIYTSGRNSDPQYLAAIATAQAKAEGAAQGFAALLPQVSVSGFARHSDVHAIERSQFSGDGGSALIKGATATLRQSLINPRRWQGYKQGKLQAAQALLEGGSAEQALIIRAAEAYFAYLTAQADVSFANAEFTALKKDLERASSRYEVGLSAVTDLQETQARHDLASAQKIDADQQLLNALDIVAELVGHHADDLPDLGPDMALTPPEGPISVWVNEGLANNLQLQSAAVSRQLAESDVKSQKSGHLPTLDATLEYDYSDSTSQDFGSRSTDARAQLVLNLPLFEGGATSSRIRQARAQLRSTQAREEQTRREVERGIRQAYRGVTSAAQRAKALNQATRSANTALKATQAGYDVGTRTTVDVLNAKRELFRAMKNASVARYDYVLQQLQLYRLQGSLGPQHVVAMNQQLQGNAK